MIEINKQVNKYISELMDDSEFIDFIENKSIIRVIDAKPGAGKTTVIQLLKGIKVLAVPTRALVNQLAKGDNCIGVLGGDSGDHEISRIRGIDPDACVTIVSTYDMTPNCIDILNDLDHDFQLVVDEFHCVAGEAAYRKAACKSIYGLFKRNKPILISGTVNHDTLNSMENAGMKVSLCSVTVKGTKQPAIHYSLIKVQFAADSIIQYLGSLGKKETAIVFVNDIKAINRVSDHCKHRGISHLVYTANSQQSPECMEFITTGDASKYQVILCTSALIQGVSIYTKITHALIVDTFYGSHPDKCVQFIYRMRNNTPKITHYRVGKEKNVPAKLGKHSDIITSIISGSKRCTPPKDEFDSVVFRHDLLFASAALNIPLSTKLFDDFGCKYVKNYGRIDTK